MQSERKTDEPKRRKIIDLESTDIMEISSAHPIIDLDGVSTSSVDEIQFNEEKVPIPPKVEDDEKDSHCTICWEAYGNSGSYVTQLEKDERLKNVFLSKCGLKAAQLDILKNAEILSSYCGHLYCGGCILQYVKASQFECPLCRVKSKFSELRRIFV